jgi:hypothetical protein
MRTPFGSECSFFYGNYFRGKSDEECRLIGNLPPPNNWTRDLCKTCPVPAIIRANACRNMSLSARITRSLGIGKRKVEITAFCSKAQTVVKTPQVGCGLCHPLDEFKSGVSEK